MNCSFLFLFSTFTQAELRGVKISPRQQPLICHQLPCDFHENPVSLLPKYKASLYDKISRNSLRAPIPFPS